MVLKYLKRPTDEKPTRVVGIKSIYHNAKTKQFVCTTDHGSEMLIPENTFIECK